MDWQKWVLLGILALNTLVAIATVGKPRRPTTPGVAVAVLVLNSLLAWAVVSS